MSLSNGSGEDEKHVDWESFYPSAPDVTFSAGVLPLDEDGFPYDFVRPLIRNEYGEDVRSGRVDFPHLAAEDFEETIKNIMGDQSYEWFLDEPQHERERYAREMMLRNILNANYDNEGGYAGSGRSPRPIDAIRLGYPAMPRRRRRSSPRSWRTQFSTWELRSALRATNNDVKAAAKLLFSG